MRAHFADIHQLHVGTLLRVDDIQIWPNSVGADLSPVDSCHMDRLEGIVKELAESNSLQFPNETNVCIFCHETPRITDGNIVLHSMDCLVVRARKAMEMNP